ncbi:MAG: FAD:protein FMN transferase [Ruminococcaceae bacterium]|nr:FAD:protein FMN transferase [Oscillospiraceae bacterium]
MKRIAVFLLAAVLCFGGCRTAPAKGQKQYTATFLNLFDTVTTVVGTAESEEAFQEKAQTVHDALLVYHRLFDIYHTYDGIANLKTVNDQAGKAPVTVDGTIMEFLTDCKAYYTQTGGKTNVMMGRVLRLWHEARTAGADDPQNARLPAADALKAAADHIAIDALEIDPAASTVYIRDPSASLDVGAVAKGWATERVAREAPDGMLISVGGNVCATGPKAVGTPWVIGISDPADSNRNCHTLYVNDGAVVTSGDYQRTYTVNGVPYHHIIDPKTQYPATLWHSVTVVAADSALADALSTALFLLPLEEGKALADACDVDVLWIGDEEHMTAGFRAKLRT